MAYLDIDDKDDISIHTLAWRVTITAEAVEYFLKDFNPHPRVEGDNELAYILYDFYQFQSTPSRGG